MILSELILFLKSIDARPKKRLSQNFLIDQNIVHKIIRTADVKRGDFVLEIGPGPGALTSALLEAGAHVFAVEMDGLFADQLARLQTLDQRLHVFEADFLEFSLSDLPSPLKVVANLPYHITAPILEKIFASFPLVSTATVMVQKEVAERMAATASTPAFGSFSLFVQLHSKIHRSFPVAASCFYPRPKVDSTVIRLDLQPPPPSIDPAPFSALVRMAFQQRRKMMSTSLQALFASADVKRALSRTGMNPDSRPEALSLEKWIEFYGAIGN